MSIATKTGDKGETSLIGGDRVRKNDVRIEAYGTVDELNALLGVCLTTIESPAVKSVISQVQHDLFTIGAELAALNGRQMSMPLPRLDEEHMAFIDSALETTEGSLPPQRNFILPKGTPGAAHLHLARTVCRRAERAVAACDSHTPNPTILKYLNRLSDLLFLFARLENKGKAPEEAVQY